MAMRRTRLLMGMPITVEVADRAVAPDDLEQVFAYFAAVDERFSTYRESSEIARINRGELDEAGYSDDVRTILALAEQTRRETHGYFDVRRDGRLDPSGIVKGWACASTRRAAASSGRWPRWTGGRG